MSNWQACLYRDCIPQYRQLVRSAPAESLIRCMMLPMTFLVYKLED